MLGTILQALPGYLVAVIDQATGFNIPEAWESFRQTTHSIKNHIGSIVNRIAEFVATAATIVLPAGLTAVRDTWDRIKNAASAVGGYVTTFIGNHGGHCFADRPGSGARHLDAGFRLRLLRRGLCAAVH
jgi:phage-related protein